MIRRFRTALATVVVSAALGGTTLGQQNQPIYPVYDGYVKNPDGSYTLSFAYFSHNADNVTIPPGSANQFVQAPADRQQPTTFKPGHWRFQCVMVVGPEFDGRMTWSLSYGGTTTGSSEKMLQSNWNLLEGAVELAKIDYAKVPKGVCLNRAPAVRVLGIVPRRGVVPSLSVGVNEELNLFGSAHDEGLPRGKAFVASWRVLKGPGTVTFSNPASPRTKATFSAAGTYELELVASDSDFTSTYRLDVIVK